MSINSPKQQLLQKIMTKYEIKPEFANDLPKLSQYHLSFIIDDSYSMNTRTSSEVTRWQELSQTFLDCLKISAPFLSEKGVDLDFLNTGSHLNIPLGDIVGIFQQRSQCPGTATPICQILKKVLLRARNRLKRDHKMTIIIIGTDGEPTDGSMSDLNQLLTDRTLRDPSRCPVTFLVCSDGPCIQYLNKLDRTATYVDVCDDFQCEQREILQASGQHITYGEYLIKCLLGSALKKYDSLDENPGQVCVVCGQNIESGEVYTKHGAKCIKCEPFAPLRSPPSCRCSKCGVVDAKRVYIKVNDNWYCSNCPKPPAKTDCLFQ